MSARLRILACGVFLALAATLASAQRPAKPPSAPGPAKPTSAPTAAASRPAPKDADSLLQEADAASKAWKSLTCKATYSYRFFGRDGGGEAELALVAEGVDRRRTVRMRADGTLAAPDGRRFSGVVEDLSRAAVAFTVVDVGGRSFERRVRRKSGEPLDVKSAGPRVYDLTNVLASRVFLRIGTGAAKNDKVELTLDGTETVGGVLCDVLQIATSSSVKMTINGVPSERRSQSQQRFAIGRHDRFLRSMRRTSGGEASDADSQSEERLELTDVRFDVPIASERFTLDVAGLAESPFGGPRSR